MNNYELTYERFINNEHCKVNKSVSRTFKYDLEDHSHIAKSSQCFFSCIYMAITYWLLYKKLSIADFRNEMEEIRTISTPGSLRGINRRNLANILRNIANIFSEKEHNITFQYDIKNIIYAEYLIPFLENDPQIPVIIIFDSTFAERKISGDLHACLLHRIDLTQEKISLIDPFNHNNEYLIPRIWDLRRFYNGWKPFKNLMIFLYLEEYKEDIKNILSLKNIKKSKQSKLTSFLNN
ncbi:MAG: hypothetical protein ACTSVV_16890 [Promethearchaeota archaeon]